MISIVIPALNPENVKPLLKAIEMNILPESHEILVESEKGYVKALLRGIKNSKGDIIVMMDGDGSHNPIFFRKMFSLLENADIVIGSRYAYGGHSNDVFIRKLISRFFCKVARALLGFNDIADVMSGFIIFRRSILNSIQLDSYGYKVGLSILMQAKGKFRIVECPIVFQRSQMGDYVKLRNIKDGFQTLMFIAKLFIHRLLKYNVQIG